MLYPTLKFIERTRDVKFPLGATLQNGGNSVSFCWIKEITRRIRFSILKQLLIRLFSNISFQPKKLSLETCKKNFMQGQNDSSGCKNGFGTSG